MKKKKTEAEKRQADRYQISLKLDPVYDKDIVDRLKQVDKKQTFIKDCIRYFDRMYSRIKVDYDKLGR